MGESMGKGGETLGEGKEAVMLKSKAIRFGKVCWPYPLPEKGTHPHGAFQQNRILTSLPIEH